MAWVWVSQQWTSRASFLFFMSQAGESMTSRTSPYNVELLTEASLVRRAEYLQQIQGVCQHLKIMRSPVKSWLSGFL